MRAATERARPRRPLQQLGTPTPPPRRRGGLVDDLVDPLVAQAQGLGDIPQRPAGRVQPADGLVVVGSGPLGGMLGHGQLLLRGLGLVQKLRIKPHLSRVARQNVLVQPPPAPEWNPRTRRIDKLTDGPVGLGTRYEGEWVKGDPMTIDFVRFQRPTSWATVGRARRLVASAEGQIWPTPGGAHLALRTRLQPQGALRLLRPVLGPIMRRREDRNLQAIKAALEQEPGSGRPASDLLQ